MAKFSSPPGVRTFFGLLPLRWFLLPSSSFAKWWFSSADSMRSASIFLSCPAKPDSPRIDSASLFSTWASNWSISSTGNGYATFCFLGCLVGIKSVMEQSFRDYFLTQFDP